MSFNKWYWIGQKVFISFQIKKHPESFWVGGFPGKHLATAAKKKYTKRESDSRLQAGGSAGTATYPRRKQKKKKKKKKTKGDS